MRNTNDNRKLDNTWTYNYYRRTSAFRIYQEIYNAPENLFIELFSDAFGAEKAAFLYPQYHFTDIYQNDRYADFFLENGGKRIAIEKEEEILNTQVTLMKSIILKIDNETIDYFYDSNINQFTILNKSLKLYDYSESMVRATIKNILLLITKLKKNSLICYLTSFPVALYYPIIIYKFKDTISQLSNTNLNKNENIYEYLEEKHGELFDTILYLNDILFCNITNINFVIINCLLNEIIFPLLNIIISKKKEKISLANSLYILSLFIFYLKNEFIIDLICSFLFKGKIRKYLLDKIKQYNYKDNNINFMKDLNYLIFNKKF